MQKETTTVYKFACDICQEEVAGSLDPRGAAGWVVARVEPIKGRDDRRYAGQGPNIEVIDVCNTCKDDFDTLRDLGRLVLSKCNSAEELEKGDTSA